MRRRRPRVIASDVGSKDTTLSAFEINRKINAANVSSGELVAISNVVPSILADGSLELDSRGSTLGEVVSGGDTGYHSITFQVIRQVLDIFGGSEPITMIEGANASTDGTYWWKNITGNSWNSYVYCSDSIGNADLNDFALSASIEVDHDGDGQGGIDGSVREMLQFSNSPTSTVSYTAGTHSAYQVNRNIQVYEGNSYKGNFPVAAEEGGRLFLKSKRGVVTVSYVIDGVEEVVYTSLKKLEGPTFARAAFNRGNASTGDSVMGGFQVHRSTLPEAAIVHIDGGAIASISTEDTEKLSSIGLFPTVGSTYGLFTASKPDTDSFPDLTEYKIAHSYYQRSTSSNVVIQA